MSVQTETVNMSEAAGAQGGRTECLMRTTTGFRMRGESRSERERERERKAAAPASHTLCAYIQSVWEVRKKRKTVCK